jgi:ubiquinone/menaquinone biosynthesis C-methylase UbiE
MNDTTLVPNHHANYKGLAGITGVIAALSMRSGREGTADLAIELTALAAGERLVDIGCGPGVAARRAAARGAIVVGVDPADTMLRVARFDDRAGAVTWRKGGAEVLPLAEHSCDVAWSLSAVHHWPDLVGGLAEVRRVLAPGGRFLATERRVAAGATGLGTHGWTDAQAARFAADCTAAGFAGVDVSHHATNRGLTLAVLARA